MNKFTVILNTQEYPCETWEEVKEIIKSNTVAPYVRFRATNHPELIIKLYMHYGINGQKMTFKNNEITVKAKDLTGKLIGEEGTRNEQEPPLNNQCGKVTKTTEGEGQ